MSAREVQAVVAVLSGRWVSHRWDPDKKLSACGLSIYDLDDLDEVMLLPSVNVVDLDEERYVYCPECEAAL